MITLCMLGLAHGVPVSTQDTGFGAADAAFTRGLAPQLASPGGERIVRDSPFLFLGATSNTFFEIMEPNGTWEMVVDGVPVTGDLEVLGLRGHFGSAAILRLDTPMTGGAEALLRLGDDRTGTGTALAEHLFEVQDALAPDPGTVQIAEFDAVHTPRGRRPDEEGRVVVQTDVERDGLLFLYATTRDGGDEELLHIEPIVGGETTVTLPMFLDDVACMTAQVETGGGRLSDLAPVVCAGDSAGCGCDAAGVGGAWSALTVLGLLGLRRRR